MAEILKDLAKSKGQIRDEQLKRLVFDVRKGNTSAFEDLVRLCEKGVYDVALQVTKNREDAMDVSQNTFLKLWQLLSDTPSKDEIESWYSYILRMAKNCALDYLRKQSIRRQDSLLSEDEDGELREMEVADEDVYSNPALAYERKERIEAVREAISSLDEKYGQALILRENEGCSYKEISDILGIEIGTVKSKIFRARSLVKEYLEKRNIF